MPVITVHLIKPGKGNTIIYTGVLLLREPGHTLIHARWERPRLDLGYVTFEPGDHFYEHFYSQRWYSIFELRDLSGVLKGWYCNVSRPAQLDGDLIVAEDLELDLFVSPDRAQILRLDLDEFAARGLDRLDPQAYAAALAALDELEHSARAGVSPFDWSA
jgi:predicted RNA-binding protein associated with RNAse of E/G family